MHRFHAIAVTLLAGICCASALRCYVCNSLSNQRCEGETVSKDLLVECDVGRNATAGLDPVLPVPGATICWKQRQEVDGITIIDRSCGKESKDKKELDSKPSFCYDRVGTKQIKVRYCICNQMDCNASNGLVASIATLALMLAASFGSNLARI